MSTRTSFFRSQLCITPPYPTKLFTGKTIIVTGSNIGMGLEAARHFVRLDATKVILAVRSPSKGLAAKSDIESTTQRLGVVEVWNLDLESHASVKSFAARATQELERLDAVVLNAGIYTFDFTITAEGDEKTITVNVVSTLLLGVLLVPKLRETGRRFGTLPVLTFNGSFTHAQTTFPERKAGNIFEGLRVEKGARMDERYQVSKLIQLLCARQLADEVSKSSKEGRVIVSVINPGFVDTSIMREAGFFFSKFMWALKKVLSRTAEVGGRTLVHAAEGDEETHGQYLDDCKIGQVSTFVMSKEGLETQKKLWSELGLKLEKIQPGVMSGI